jgi:hypothetical protein
MASRCGIITTMTKVKRAHSVELPGRSFSKRERRTRYWRRWARRSKTNAKCFYVEIDRTADIQILVDLGFLKPNERDDARAIRSALQAHHDAIFGSHAQGVGMPYRSRALGRSSR